MAEKGGKKPVASSAGKKKTAGASKLYSVEGGKLKRNNLTCPKCGNGVYMAKHKDRTTCGNCHYTEFSTKKKK